MSVVLVEFKKSEVNEELRLVLTQSTITVENMEYQKNQFSLGL